MFMTNRTFDLRHPLTHYTIIGMILGPILPLGPVLIILMVLQIILSDFLLVCSESALKNVRAAPISTCWIFTIRKPVVWGSHSVVCHIGRNDTKCVGVTLCSLSYRSKWYQIRKWADVTLKHNNFIQIIWKKQLLRPRTYVFIYVFAYIIDFVFSLNLFDLICFWKSGCGRVPCVVCLLPLFLSLLALRPNHQHLTLICESTWDGEYKGAVSVCRGEHTSPLIQTELLITLCWFSEIVVRS